MCMRASGASELRKFWQFHILKLLFLSIFCWYIENKSWFNFIWEPPRAPQASPPPTSTPVVIFNDFLPLLKHFAHLFKVDKKSSPQMDLS